MSEGIWDGMMWAIEHIDSLPVFVFNQKKKRSLKTQYTIKENDSIKTKKMIRRIKRGRWKFYGVFVVQTLVNWIVDWIFTYPVKKYI